MNNLDYAINLCMAEVWWESYAAVQCEEKVEVWKIVMQVLMADP